MRPNLPPRPPTSRAPLHPLLVLQVEVQWHSAVKCHEGQRMDCSHRTIHHAVHHFQYEHPTPKEDQVHKPIRVQVAKNFDAVRMAQQLHTARAEGPVFRHPHTRGYGYHNMDWGHYCGSG